VTVDRRAWVIICAVASVVAVLAGVLASSGEVLRWEEVIFHAVNDLPDWLEAPMWVFQLAGLLFVPLGVAVVAAVFRKWWLVLALVALVPLKLLVEKGIVKQLVERERPGTTICDYEAADPTAFDATCGNFRGDVPLDGLSFVSGHAIIAWGVAALLWTVLPGRWRWVPVAIASLNAIARVYLGAHNPLDVIGGGAIGVAIAAVSILVIGAVRSSSHDHHHPAHQEAMS
jgi:membrane-associated phospholipid phosphatase